ncbi:peptidylprolyl isomerase [Marinicauda algicola]|uniref:peptidylprolyl isomerase n=1 Tax=Marinicauda algicola TaxID=2029849 RepID=A0A4S2GWW7_9PROT|nr:peptidylprolyl isomerase [Marinicauda algicola]TGY87378.1 peptidylprolyl isomerase [Marinicauda algicola]
MRRLFALALAGLSAACSPDTATRDDGALPRAVVETSLGAITIELREDAAPVTVANFIAHAGAGHLDGGSFYRTSRPDNARADAPPMYIIQGGHSFDGLPGAEGIAHEPTEETGLSHVRGAVSMARDEVGTATTEFFITINDVPGLDSGPDGRNPDGAGYAVFGAVVDGMEVVEAIWQQPAGRSDAPEGFASQFLVEPVRIERVRIERP